LTNIEASLAQAASLSSVTTALWFAALAASALSLAAATVGCDSIDPTSQFFGITFKNDIGRSVHLELCDNDGCTHFDYSDGWKSGVSSEENVSDRELLTRWLVQDDRTKRTLGCLPLQFDEKYSNVVVKLSQLVSCPGKTPLTVSKGEGLGRS
jgi:hypothetical protein